MSPISKKLLDAGSAILVLIALLFVKGNPTYWLLYSVGCIGYAILGFKNNLYGLGILNVVVAIIGLKNFLF